MIRVIIADDHRLMLDGLVQGLTAIPDIDVVGTVESGEELADAVQRFPDDLKVSLQEDA